VELRSSFVPRVAIEKNYSITSISQFSPGSLLGEPDMTSRTG
jgi:hypothetical protein